MNEAKNTMKIVGMILLGLFALVVAVPIVIVAAGVTLGIFFKLVGLAILAIKLAVFVAIVYLVVVGVRAFLR